MTRVIIFIFTVLGTVCCLGTQRNVPGDFSTLQAAIDGSTAGDVIVLTPGTYTGDGNRDLNFKGKAITLQSGTPTDSGVVAATIIDCQGSAASPHRAFTFSNHETASSILDGITVTNGWMQSGGAIYCDNASPTIRNCTFRQNTANFYAGGIYCTNSSAPTLTQCIFNQNNTVQIDGLGGLDGGAVYCNLSSNAKITSCTFTNNSGKSGAGIYCNASNPVISLCTFTGNTAALFGGTVACWASAPAITNCLIVNNIAQYAGGGVACQSTSLPSLVNCTFSQNTGVSFSGGGVFCNGDSNPSLKNMILWNNDPNEIKMVSGTPTVTYSNVKGGWSGTGNINADPLFANPDQGDFHLKSVAGRFDPQTGIWVTDTETSLCVDGGDPASDYSNEPAGTGQIVDLGFYGNTAEASKTPDKVDLTISVVEGQGTVSPTSEPCNQGILLPLTATPATGYRIKAWTGTNDDSSTATTNTVKMDTNRTVTVAFEALPYTLTLSVTGDPPHGTVTSDPAGPTIPYGTQVNFTAVPETGYRVKAWTGTDHAPMPGSNTNTLLITANATVSVEFEKAYQLTATVQGGNGTITPDQGTYPDGTEVLLTAAPAAGYRVKSWSGTISDTSTATTNTVKMDADKTVGVTFEAVAYTLTVTQTEHGTITADPNGSMIPCDTVVNFTAVPEAGYRVAAWTGTDHDPAAGSNNNFLKMNEERCVSATFEPLPLPENYFTLAAEVKEGEGQICPQSGYYDPNAVVPLIATPAAGRQVKAWTGTDNDTSRENTNTVTMTADKQVTVTFEAIPVNTTFTLTTLIDGGHGTVSPTGVAYDAGTQVTLTATPEDGYRVATWSGTDNDTSKENTNTVTMTADKQVTVTFEAIPVNTTFTLTTLVDGGHGTVSPTGVAYDAGTQVALIATPEDGYRVATWSGTDNDTSKENTNTVTMTADKQVTVTFEAIPVNTTFTLTTLVDGGHGTVSPTGVAYDAGTQVTLIATPEDGYRVATWSGTDNDTSKENTNTVTMTADKQVTVTFEQIPLVKQYSLTVSVLGGHGSVVPTAGQYAEGMRIYITATPDPGYRVKAWTNTDFSPLPGTDENSVTMTEDKEVTVTFEAIPTDVYYTLRVVVVGGSGTVSPADGKFLSSTVIALTASPASGYRVKQWINTDNDQSTENTNSVTMSYNRTVMLELEAIPSQPEPNQSLLPNSPSLTPTPTATQQDTSPVVEETASAPQNPCGYAAPLLFSLFLAFGYLTKE